MRVSYLLDTNVISEPLKPMPNKRVIDKISRYRSEIAIPVFVIYELTKGMYQLPESKKRSRISYYIEYVVYKLPILPYTKAAAIWQGKETARLRHIGKSPSFSDMQIASIAKTKNLILVTHNIVDFQYISELKLEDWFN